MRDKRLTASQRGYGSRWQISRLAYLLDHPLCAACSTPQRVVMATDVDHIKPHKNNQELFWDQNNWQSLCHTCHSRKTATEDGAFGNRQGKVRANKSCGLDGLPVDSRHHWNR